MPSNQANMGGNPNFTLSFPSSSARRREFDSGTTEKDTLYVGNLPCGKRVKLDVLQRELEDLFAFAQGRPEVHVKPVLFKGSPQVLVKFENVLWAKHNKEWYQDSYIESVKGRRAGVNLAFARHSWGQGESLTITRARTQAPAAASSTNRRGSAQPHVPFGCSGPMVSTENGGAISSWVDNGATHIQAQEATHSTNWMSPAQPRLLFGLPAMRASAEAGGAISSRVDNGAAPLPHLPTLEDARSEAWTDDGDFLPSSFGVPAPSGTRASAGDFVPSSSRVRIPSPPELTPSPLPPLPAARPSEPHRASERQSRRSPTSDRPRKPELRVITGGPLMNEANSPQPRPVDVTQQRHEEFRRQVESTSAELVAAQKKWRAKDAVVWSAQTVAEWEARLEAERRAFQLAAAMEQQHLRAMAAAMQATRERSTRWAAIKLKFFDEKGNFKK